MSGIAGLFYRDGQPVASAALEAMAARLAHRGADGAGAWRAGPVGLAHRLRWTTPESLHERQPLAAGGPAGVLVLTADARIDNRAELAAEVGLDDRDLPDSAFILAAYQKWGQGCAEHLLGDFAFAIWDERRQHIFCARDPLGVKAFFYYLSPRLFAFASELKALFCLPACAGQPNELAIADYLAPVMPDPAQTFYQGLLRLPGGHCLTVARDRFELRRCWSVDLGREMRLPSSEAYAEAFREVFAQAVGCRLRSAFPVASMLSGGLDSASVTSMAGRLLAGTGRRLHTLSVCFPKTPESDEQSYSQAVTDAGDYETHSIDGDRLSPLMELDRVLWRLDEPFRSPGFALHFGVYQAMQGLGLRQVLGGSPGDSVISYGFARLAELTRGGHGLTLLRELRAYGAASGQGWPRLARLWWFNGARPLAPGWAAQWARTARAARSARASGRPAWSLGSLIKPAFAWQIEHGEALRAWRARQTPPRRQRDEHWQALQWMAPLPDAFDLAAPAWGVEHWHPMTDRRLVEFCLALPPEQKFGQGYTRLSLRQAMRGILPEPVRLRMNKKSPMHSLARTVLRDERLDEILRDGAALLEPYVDPLAVARAYAAIRAEAQPGPRQWPALIGILQLAILARWLRQASGASALA